MMLAIGPAGLGPVKGALITLENYYKKGFRACEIAFTYGVYIKQEADARAIGLRARELGITLSIHAPYYVNLNSEDVKKRAASKERILECCRVGALLGARTVVFHPGYYSKDKEASYQTIKEGVNELLENVRKEGWKITLAPETMGKINVFGSIEEIARLARETGCGYCIDFAHILARDKIVDYEKVELLFPQKQWHVHFSGILYGDKGEKSHKPTESDEWKTLFAKLPRDREIVLINESPTMIDDCAEGLALARSAHLLE